MEMERYQEDSFENILDLVETLETRSSYSAEFLINSAKIKKIEDKSSVDLNEQEAFNNNLF